MRLLVPSSPARTEPTHALSRFRRLSGLLGLIGSAALLTSAHADGTLTLTLPPSEAAVAARAAQQQARTVRTTTMPQQYRRSRASFRGAYPSRGGTGADHVVGRLGQLTQATPILRSPYGGSPMLISVPAGTYVAIQNVRGDWRGILMADGSTGWLRAASLRPLDYQVVSSGSPTGAMGSSGYPSTNVPMLNSSQQAILNEAYRYLGVPYVWGGNTARGIDCSGFVKNVFGACGYNLPRRATEQMAYGLEIAPDQLQPADRLYFGHKKNGYGVTHTGIYIGNGYFIHSSSSRHGVAISRLSEPLFARIFVCARR